MDARFAVPSGNVLTRTGLIRADSLGMELLENVQNPHARRQQAKTGNLTES